MLHCIRYVCGPESRAFAYVDSLIPFTAKRRDRATTRTSAEPTHLYINIGTVNIFLQLIDAVAVHLRHPSPPPCNINARRIRHSRRWVWGWAWRNESVRVRLLLTLPDKELILWFHSRYLVKPADTDWSDGIIALEAGVSERTCIQLILTTSSGSGRGALTQILKHNPTLFSNETSDSTHNTSYSAASIYSFVR